MRAALKEADFDSVRGNYSYGNNHMPIQNFYLREVVEDDARVAGPPKSSSTVLTNHQDPYAGSVQALIERSTGCSARSRGRCYPLILISVTWTGSLLITQLAERAAARAAAVPAGLRVDADLRHHGFHQPVARLVST